MNILVEPIALILILEQQKKVSCHFKNGVDTHDSTLADIFYKFYAVLCACAVSGLRTPVKNLVGCIPSLYCLVEEFP